MSVDPVIAQPARDNRMGPDLRGMEAAAVRGALAAAKRWLAAPRLDASFLGWLPWLSLTLGVGLALIAGGLALGGVLGLLVGLLSVFTLPVAGGQLVIAMAVSESRPPPACPDCQRRDSPFQPYDSWVDFTEHAPELFVAQAPLVFMSLPFGARCTVLRFGGDLLVHSPIHLTKVLREELAELGEVRWILAPNVLHHLFVPEWVEAFPSAEVWAAPKLAARRPDIAWTGTLEHGQSPPWPCETLVVRGHDFHVEVVLFDARSGTLVLTDLLENLGHAPETSTLLRVVLGLLGMGGRATPPTDLKWTLSEPEAMKADLETMLAWPIERIVLAHGRLVDVDAKETLRRAFAFLG
jgi:hypothetical protein